MALGIVAGLVFTPGPAAAGLLALAALSAGWLLFINGRDRAAAALVLAAVAAAGAARLVLQDRRYEANPLHRLEAGGYVDVTGELARSPGRELDKDVLLLSVRSVRAEGQALAIRGRLRLSVPFARGVRRRLTLLAGDAVTVSVRLSPGVSFRNFGGFSYERYLKGLNVHRRASTKTALLVSPATEGRRRTLRSWISRLRAAAQSELERRFPSDDGRDISPKGAVLEALLLGEDGRLDAPTVEILQKTGLYHLFAISGGHIAVLNVLLFSLFRLTRMSLRASRLALAVFLVFYTLFVEGSPSVLRATLMTLAYLTGKLLWKDVHILNTISASAFILLFLNPFSLLDVGFQLTYAATLSIIVFTPPLLRRLPRLPFKAAELACLSVTAALAVTPLLALHFNRVTLSSLLLNFAAIPLVALVMGLGYAFLPLAALWPAAAGPPAAALGLLVDVFLRLCHILDPLPFLSFRVPTPKPWVLAGYFLFLGLSLAKPRLRGHRAGTLAGLALFSLGLASYPFRPACRDLRVTMIDVGQGDALFVQFPGRKVMLIDGGGLAGSPFDVGERVVSPFLWRKGIRKVDYLVLTHPHPDHLDGLAAVARNFRVGEFWEGLPGRPEGGYSALGRALAPTVVRRRRGRGDELRVGAVGVAVLHPKSAKAEGPALAENEASLVLRITLGRASFLFMGDAGPAAERELLASGLDIKAAVLKAGHHGSSSSGSAAFLEAVEPRVILVSVGPANVYGFPGEAFLGRCRAARADICRTDIHGAVEIRTDGRALRVRTASEPAKSLVLHLTPTTKSMIIVRGAARP